MVNEYVLQHFTKEKHCQLSQPPHSEGVWPEKKLLDAAGIGRRDFDFTHVVFISRGDKPSICLFYEMKESVQTIIIHLVVKLDDIDVDEVSQCVDKVLEAVPRDHLPVFFCGREDSCLVHQDLIINREWKHEKKHGNAQSQRSIKCLENKFNLLVPWGDHESRSVVAFHASQEFKAYYRNSKLDKKLMQVKDQLSNANLKKARDLFQMHTSKSLSIRKQCEEHQDKQMILHDQGEDLLCEQKYHDDAMNFVTQKLQKMDNAYKKSPTMKRHELKTIQTHVKRHSQFMAIRQNDENGITSSMENMHIDTQTETID